MSETASCVDSSIATYRLMSTSSSTEVMVAVVDPTVDEINFNIMVVLLGCGMIASTI